MPDTKPLERWLYFCCFMIFVMAIIGAITRLTESGLSITEWKPVTGALPPLSSSAWEETFAGYRASPEFLHKHSWMTLADFKKIFFWEWLHRLWGRMIGITYALPLLWFCVRRQIPKGFGAKLLGLLILGSAQGLIGWWMVQSGLVDRPNVSHFRLAAHLGLALVIFAAMLWVALDLRNTRLPAAAIRPRANLVVHAGAALALLALTIVWGAFVAGLDAGLVYNDFPLMNGRFTPAEPFDLLRNHGWVQFTHRWLAVTTGIVLLALGIRRRNPPLIVFVLLQVALGIATLWSGVWLPLAALHQAGAVAVLALTIVAAHGLYVRARISR